MVRDRVGCGRAEEFVRYGAPLPRGPAYEFLAIDDHAIVESVPLESLRRGVPVRPRRGADVFARAHAAYLGVGLVPHPDKAARDRSATTLLGAELDGIRGVVSAPRGRLAALAALTLRLCCAGRVTRRSLDSVVGCWVHVLLFRRVAFCLMSAVFA